MATTRIIKSVGLVEQGISRLYGTSMGQIHHVIALPLTCWAYQPGIITAFADIQDFAHTADPKIGLILSDKPKSYWLWLAKKADAFFRMSRSSVTRANSRFNRLFSAAWSSLLSASDDVGYFFTHEYSECVLTPNL